MSARAFVTVALVLAAVVVGWRVFLPASDKASEQVVQNVTAALDTVARAQFTGAQATLETQHRMTGAYTGAVVAAPIRLARVDATSYCLELVRGAQVAHLAGPGGAPAPGPCTA